MGFFAVSDEGRLSRTKSPPPCLSQILAKGGGGLSVIPTGPKNNIVKFVLNSRLFLEMVFAITPS